MTTRLRQLAGRAGLGLAFTGLTVAATLTIAAPAQAASLKVASVQCYEETDEIGNDSPYFMVFAASLTNPSATAFGKWGPGSLDNNVASGSIFYPGASIIGSVPSGWVLISIMMEEDDGNDMSSLELQNIGNNMHNYYQIWFGSPFMASQMRAMLISMADDYSTNDDIVATASSSVGDLVAYVGDGGNYRVRYTN